MKIPTIPCLQKIMNTLMYSSHYFRGLPPYSSFPYPFEDPIFGGHPSFPLFIGTSHIHETMVRYHMIHIITCTIHTILGLLYTIILNSFVDISLPGWRKNSDLSD